jgi:hypothetical protein
MIHVDNKRYQVALWVDEDRSDGGLRLQFDTLAEAAAEFEKRKREGGLYRSGILFEWLKNSGQWRLIDQFPKE